MREVPQGRRVGDAGVGASPVAVAGYIALLLLVFVTLQPFNPPPILAVTGNVHQAEAGGLLHQVIALTTLLVIAGAAMAKRGLGVVKVIPMTLGLLLAWSLVSAAWAITPDLTARRAAAQIVFATSVLLSVDTLGYARAGRLLGFVLIGVLAVNWISIPLIPTAVHAANEVDPSLIGDWRGLYIQKNAAGAVTALTIMMMIFFSPVKSRWLTAALVTAALGFLIMTRSKTSLGLLPVAIAVGALYGVCWRNYLTRGIFLILAAIILYCGAVFLSFNIDWLARLFENPAEFTGRTEIWKADLAFLGDHFWLGGGFGVSSDTTAISFLQNYVSSLWVREIGSTHNGYLDVAVNLGVIGLVLTTAAVIVRPLMLLWPLDEDGVEKAGFCAIVVFVLLHNLTESDFLSTESPVWFAFLFAIAGLRNRGLRHTPIPRTVSNAAAPGQDAWHGAG
jgi:exopolysaccharide production protein ExoQ